ncbi:molybdenum cofactor biosynthesis protein MoaE [Methanolacinia paynteri]|uniref:molybdenum cofactor biosynthesis protein MoaE n=1 Tax=Methanolacinia paynteri TaxID=230356 RepID=UPI000693B603|nr:molybdenum cofactor biosynthesis protein MoaE [Methanolacinia paynteri]
MKIIHITGESHPENNTATAEFIEKLSVLNPGKTGVICNFGPEKPPESKCLAPYSAKVHNAGTIVAIKDADLSGTLDLFSDSGIFYAIILGFEGLNYKKAIFGDLDAENCILKDPSADEIIEALDKFDDHYTMQGLVKELKEEVDIPRTGCYLHFNGIVREITGEERTEYMDFSDYDYIDKIIAEIRKDMEKVPGILGVRFYHSKGRLYAGDDVTYIAVAASHRQEAFKAVMDAIDRLKADLHNKK